MHVRLKSGCKSWMHPTEAKGQKPASGIMHIVKRHMVKGITQVGVTWKGITQIGITQKSITQVGITPKGITQIGITQIDVTRKGITRKYVTQIGITRKTTVCCEAEPSRLAAIVKMCSENRFLRALVLSGHPMACGIHISHAGTSCYKPTE